MAVGIFVQNLLQSRGSADLDSELVSVAWEALHYQPIHLHQAVLAVVVSRDHQDETQDLGTQADGLGLECPPCI